MVTSLIKIVQRAFEQANEKLLLIGDEALEYASVHLFKGSREILKLAATLGEVDALPPFITGVRSALHKSQIGHTPDQTGDSRGLQAEHFL
jgi:hypothetical protein